MRKIVLIGMVLTLATSCLKKIQAVDELNTNVFDRDYTGDTWFEITSLNTYVNIDGQTRVKVKAKVPHEKLPGLKPTFMRLDCQVNNQDFGVINAPLNTSGDYVVELDAVPDGTTYCLTMGVYVEEDNETINVRTDCTDL